MNAEKLFNVLGLIVGVAMVAVIFQSAHTAAVVGAFGTAFSQSIGAAQGNIRG